MEPEEPTEVGEAERPRRCPTCGTPYSRGNEGLGCPVCLFRRAFDPDSEGERGSTGGGPSRPADGRFDHYELAQRQDRTFDQLGQGAMGVTYRALDTVPGHAVALKVIDARIAARPDARKLFLREARAAARLRHPNIASVFYCGVRKSDGQCFYAMELVEGETLEARMLRKGPLPPLGISASLWRRPTRKLSCNGHARLSGLDALQQVEANFQGRRFLFRSQLTVHASQAVRATGVAIPATLQEPQ